MSEQNLEIRTAKLHENVSDQWYWPKGETGAWDGPVVDWIKSHSKKYFTPVKKYQIAVCAGANMGLYARVYASLFDIVYAFEPDPSNFYYLVRNVPEENVIKLQLALGSEESMCSMKRNKTNHGAHRVDVQENGKIPMFSLDRLQLQNLDFLQLDVEGYEYNILLGASRLIETFKPVVIVENRNSDIENFLYPLGYELIDNSISDTIYAI